MSEVAVDRNDRLLRMLREVVPANRFYAEKFAGYDLDDFASLPFTTKGELVRDQIDHPPYGRGRTYPPDRYCRLHQTSGTSSGRPLRWFDTAESWDWLLQCWSEIFSRVGLVRGDVVFFPFSFGPFLGFWSAFESACRSGFLCLPGGGLSSTARLKFLLEHRATVVCCTPTYALHLAELAAQEGIDLAGSTVRCVIVAGEPGGSITATRNRIESVWGARLFDHYGMTEIGPVAVESFDRPGAISVLQDHFLPEVVSPTDGRPCADGEVGELVLTNLGRWGSPLIRYRTGDLVKARWEKGSMYWDGGVLGRTDDMLHVRGNNLYPSAVEAVIRRFAEVAEFRMVVDHRGSMADLEVEIEPLPGVDDRSLVVEVARALRDDLLFRIDVSAVAPGTLPRYEMKAKRVVVKPTGSKPTTT